MRRFIDKSAHHADDVACDTTGNALPEQCESLLLWSLVSRPCGTRPDTGTFTFTHTHTHPPRNQ